MQEGLETAAGAVAGLPELTADAQGVVIGADTGGDPWGYLGVYVTAGGGTSGIGVQLTQAQAVHTQNIAIWWLTLKILIEFQ